MKNDECYVNACNDDPTGMLTVRTAEDNIRRPACPHHEETIVNSWDNTGKSRRKKRRDAQRHYYNRDGSMNNPDNIRDASL